MKNPLRKRIPRELRQELGKYLVILVLMVGTIGFVSGFLVADGSMILAYQEGFEKYNVEDGNFRTERSLNRAQRKEIQALGISLYDLYYAEEAQNNGSTLRIYMDREEVNLVCLMEGTMPERADEIAVDRMYADNNGIRPGDILEGEERSWRVTGLVALPDYSCLFADNNDSMFDAVKFGVAVVTEEAFLEFDSDMLTYCYAWKYDEAPMSEEQEREWAKELMKKMTAELKLESFVPRYANQAICFTGEDMGSDKAMMTTLLYIVIVILAFVFGVTEGNTITREANVIGTLRASGYTRGELLLHYMTMPLTVTFISALLGNLLGYTWFKDVCAGMYYGSYSLPTYETVWNAEAFWMTTAVPVLLMAAISFALLKRKLTLSPLKFLRRDLRRGKQRKSLPLPPFLPFFSRFRLRVVFQNMGNYAVLFLGILFANILLMFGLALPELLDYYQRELEENMLCEYQYLLQIPMDAMNEERKLQSMIRMLMFRSAVETENEDAEKFSSYSLQTIEETIRAEEILFYGVQQDSRYIPIDTSGQEVYISSAYADKYQLSEGDSITLKERYEEEQYTFYVAGIYDYMGSVAVFMNQAALNEVFDLGEDYFCGYLSDTPITDIDEEYIASVIDLEALTKISRQLKVSMGSMMTLVDGFSVIMFVVLIYLLSKIIIEKNAQSISMAKILGYQNSEIARLYIASTSVVVAVSLLVSLPLVHKILLVIFRAMLSTSMTGWLPLVVENDVYVKMFAIGIATYGIVAIMEYGRIRRVPMEEALKCVE
ncbi:MAG: ABC transporter permease [Candidatus Gastranaerophilales bacterium]|nr:ABC transporter permease [Candidatus Gastranaerophilales bacterium]